MRSVGIDLTVLIAVACRYLGIDENELGSRTRRIKIARARAVIGYIATQELAISGSEVACRFNIDRSAVSRAVQRVASDSELTMSDLFYLSSPSMWPWHGAATWSRPAGSTTRPSPPNPPFSAGWCAWLAIPPFQRVLGVYYFPASEGPSSTSPSNGSSPSSR